MLTPEGKIWKRTAEARAGEIDRLRTDLAYEKAHNQILTGKVEALREAGDGLAESLGAHPGFFHREDAERTALARWREVAS